MHAKIVNFNFLWFFLKFSDFLFDKNQNRYDLCAFVMTDRYTGNKTYRWADLRK